jgi:hypothetical protein
MPFTVVATFDGADAAPVAFAIFPSDGGVAFGG